MKDPVWVTAQTFLFWWEHFIIFIEELIKCYCENASQRLLNCPASFLYSLSVQFSCSVMSDSLRSQELQHPRPPCHHQLLKLAQTHVHQVSDAIQPSHPTISSSAVPFSSCLQTFPVSGSFPMSQFFPSGGQSIGASTTASLLPMNILDWFPVRLTGLISLHSKGLSSLLQHHSSKASILLCSTFFIVQLSHPYMTTGKTIALTRWNLVGKVMFLLFNMLSRLVIAFLLRSKHLLISWLQSPSAVIWEPKKIKSHCFHCFPIYLPWSDGTRCHSVSFLNVEF